MLRRNVADSGQLRTGVPPQARQQAASAVRNAGTTLLGADRLPWTTGFGRLPDHLEARITALSEHHAMVAWAEAESRPELGATSA